MKMMKFTTAFIIYCLFIFLYSVSNANREMDELRREKSVMEARISELLRRL